MAMALATMSTCRRKSVGCLAVDIHGRIVAHGFNGVPRGMKHCHVSACPMAEGETCMAIHAEANAMLHCADSMAIDTVYCTLEPCFNCAKLLSNTSIRRLVYVESTETHHGIELLQSLNVKTDKIRVEY